MPLPQPSVRPPPALSPFEVDFPEPCRYQGRILAWFREADGSWFFTYVRARRCLKGTWCYEMQLLAHDFTVVRLWDSDSLHASFKPHMDMDGSFPRRTIATESEVERHAHLYIRDNIYVQHNDQPLSGMAMMCF